MFLEFTRAPGDYVVEGREVQDNQYSVFGPSASEAATQVGGTGEGQRVKWWRVCYNASSGSDSEGTGDSSSGFYSCDAVCEALLPPLQVQAKVAGSALEHTLNLHLVTPHLVTPHLLTPHPSHSSLPQSPPSNSSPSPVPLVLPL